uniref:Kelch repeat and BTB domain containing 12 n=1 Tax=Poecilia latipinna TaxID=48699 RepID=A0A3B3U4E7_9TELE
MESEVQPSAQEQHGSFLLRQLARMRAAEELTDVVLLAEGISFPCHKVVLSAFSPYFQAMFTCGLKETRGGEVPLRDTAAQSLELLLKFMYSAELPLCNDNIQGVAAAAFLFLLPTMLFFFRLCQSHMEAHMDASNSVGLYYWARDLGATDLADCALRYICQHFTQVCEEEEVLDLDAQRLGTLLGSDDLNISQEELVLELVLRWVERHRDNSQSKTQAVELLRRVRLELVDPGFLRKARRRNPTSGLCETSAPPRPPLRYGMETTDLLLCLGGVNTEGVPARRGGLADQSFCFAPLGRKTYYIPSPLRDCGGQGQVTAGAVTLDRENLGEALLCTLQRHVRFGVGRRCSVPRRRSDESAQSLRHNGQCGQMVAEERRQLAQFLSFTSCFGLPLRCEPEGASLRAGGLDPTGTMCMRSCVRRKSDA